MSKWQDTDLGRIPNKWSIGTLGGISELLTDGSHYSPKEVSSGFYMASVKDMRYNKFEFSECKTISEEDFQKLKTSKCSPREGDILLSKDGANCLELIFVYKQKEEIVVLSSIAIARLKKGYNPDFFRYYLLSKNAQYLMRANFVTGSAIPRVILKDFKNVPVPIPSLEEQKAIAEILGSFDEKIDLLYRNNKALEELAETLFRQWFVEMADENWEMVDLEFVAKRITDGSHFSPKSRDQGLPMASVKDMHSWGIDVASCRLISKDDFAMLVQNDCKPMKHDILIAKDGSYLKHIFVAPNDLDVVVLSSIAIIRPNGKYHPLLLSTLLKLSSTKEELENIVTGAVIPRIVLKDFRKFKIRLPSKSAQEAAIPHFDSIYEQCWSNVKQIETLTKLRDGLLPKLMAGEINLTEFKNQMV